MSEKQPTLEGMTVTDADPDRLREALEFAFDYRGDVSITSRSRGEPVVGFVYDRVTDTTRGEARLRIMPTDGSPRLTIPYADITEVHFSGRDTAAGRSFESWMKQYVRKKLAGEQASIEAEPMD